VARALEGLPLVQGAFETGELPYSKVRALVRAATPATEHELVDLAREATAAQLERLVNLYGKAVEAAISDETMEARDARRGADRYVDGTACTCTSFACRPRKGSSSTRQSRHPTTSCTGSGAVTVLATSACRSRSAAPTR
jgi:hypothetical protein